MIGAATTGLLGARHDPEIARRAFEESKAGIEELISGYSTVIVIATGGKGTGTGTIVPAALLAREQKKLVIPIFIRPSFERHEVEKQRYDQALEVSRRLDAAQIRFIEILNDRGLRRHRPAAAIDRVGAHERADCARAARAAVRAVGSLAGRSIGPVVSLCGPWQTAHRFLRAGSAGGNRSRRPALSGAVQACWENPFCNFSGPVGTSLVCIQGPWSNVADAKIKSGLAAQAIAPAPPPTIRFMREHSRCPSRGESPRCSRSTPAIIRRST